MSDDFMKKYYEQLVGFKIKSFEMVDDGDCLEPFPCFVLHNPKTKETIKIEVSMDEEGNGGGFLFIEPIENSLVLKRTPENVEVRIGE